MSLFGLNQYLFIDMFVYEITYSGIIIVNINFDKCDFLDVVDKLEYFYKKCILSQ